MDENPEVLKVRYPTTTFHIVIFSKTNELKLLYNLSEGFFSGLMLTGNKSRAHQQRDVTYIARGTP